MLPMTLAEAIETTSIHSVAGLTGGRTAFVTRSRVLRQTSRLRMWTRAR
jgi:hypothetical protein